MAYRQADLAKIGKEGFDIIDKYYGRPKRNIGRPAPPPGYPHGNNFCQGSEVPPLPQMKELKLLTKPTILRPKFSVWSTEKPSNS
jgi:hypothetical protein